MPFLQKCAKKFVHFCCRAPRGARGLKFLIDEIGVLHSSRAPRGARGLKCELLLMNSVKLLSRPSRGAWIEIKLYEDSRKACRVAPLAGRVD